MLKEESYTLGLKCSATRARFCDTCLSAPSTVFCRADSAYLCMACDAEVHAANKLSSRHDRVWVCEACEQAPAAFVCKADAASLCTACDAKIHSTNSLAQRHHRVAVLPIPGSLYGPHIDPRSVIGLGVESQTRFLSQEAEDTMDDDNEDETSSWLLFDAPAKIGQNQNGNDGNNGFLFNGGEDGVDEYFDLVEYNSCQETQFSDDQHTTDTCKHHNIQQQQRYSVPQKSYGGVDADSVVPVQRREATKHHQLHRQSFQYQKFQLGMEYDTSSAGYGFPASLSQSVSVSSLDVGVVPESISDVSHPRPSKGTIDLFSSPLVQVPTQLTPMDREARVLRYREKKKTRKFEKTIRYASRKAYAETRPRIKGRFAKRTNADIEVDQMFSTTLMTEGGYCIVPSFPI